VTRNAVYIRLCQDDFDFLAQVRSDIGLRATDLFRHLLTQFKINYMRELELGLLPIEGPMSEHNQSAWTVEQQ
jgi:hypothetical protein